MANPTAKSLCDIGPFMLNVRSSLFYNDLFTYTSAGGEGFTTIITNSGTVAAYATGGLDTVLHTTGTTEGNYAYLRSTNSNWLMQANEPMYFATRITYANQATTTAWVGAGFASTTTLTITSETDPTASYTGALIYKVNGGTLWKCQSSNASTKTTSQSNVTATDGTYDLAIAINNFDGAQAEIAFYVNGVQLTDSNNIPIKHKVSYTSAADMYCLTGCLAGSNNAQTMKTDYVATSKLRV